MSNREEKPAAPKPPQIPGDRREKEDHIVIEKK